MKITMTKAAGAPVSFASRRRFIQYSANHSIARLSNTELL